MLRFARSVCSNLSLMVLLRSLATLARFWQYIFKVSLDFDIPGAFPQGDWPQDEHPGYIMFEGIMVDMICETDTSYYDKIIWSKDCKKKLLYGRLIEAVYGTLLGANIFYNNLSKHLTNHGFVQNKYNMCTFNKMVNGEQITVQFHVDDLKVSHKEQSVLELEHFLGDLRSEFGQEDKLTEAQD